MGVWEECNREAEKTGHGCGQMDLSPAEPPLRSRVACMPGLFPPDRKEGSVYLGTSTGAGRLILPDMHMHRNG